MAKKSNTQAKVEETKVDELVKADEVTKADETKADENVKTDEANVDETKVEAPKVLKFTKKQILNSRKFANRKDLLTVLLKDKNTYSIKEVESVINNFLLGKK